MIPLWRFQHHWQRQSRCETYLFSVSRCERGNVFVSKSGTQYVWRVAQKYSPVVTVFAA